MNEFRDRMTKQFIIALEYISVTGESFYWKAFVYQFDLVLYHVRAIIELFARKHFELLELFEMFTVVQKWRYCRRAQKTESF